MPLLASWSGKNIYISAVTRTLETTRECIISVFLCHERKDKHTNVQTLWGKETVTERS